MVPVRFFWLRNSKIAGRNLTPDCRGKKLAVLQRSATIFVWSTMKRKRAGTNRSQHAAESVHDSLREEQK